MLVIKGLTSLIFELMPRKGDTSPTVYSRGRFKIEGFTESDRECMREDNRRYWRYKILMAILAIIVAVGQLLKVAYIYFK